jgi:hypothetical protein
MVSHLCTVSQSVVQGLSTKQPPASERMFNRFLGPTQRVSGEGRCLRSPAAAWVILEHRKFSCRGAGVWGHLAHSKRWAVGCYYWQFGVIDWLSNLVGYSRHNPTASWPSVPRRGQLCPRLKTNNPIRQHPQERGRRSLAFYKHHLLNPLSNSGKESPLLLPILQIGKPKAKVTAGKWQCWDSKKSLGHYYGTCHLSPALFGIKATSSWVCCQLHY